MSRPLCVLIIEDSEDDTAMLVHELRRAGYDPTFERVDTAQAMTAALDRRAWDVVICDYKMPEFSAPRALELMKMNDLDLPFIIVSGSVGEELAVAAMKSGAHDYIMKDNLTRLIPAIDRELREARVRGEHRRAEQTIRYLAYYDPLTDLPNRTFMRDRLQQAILAGQHENHPVAFLLIDLDRFKEINDTLGHPRGDLLLQKVASLFRRVLWEPDMVARLGGDEFAVLLPRLAAAEHVKTVIQKIINALETPFVIEGLPVSVEASIGVALYPDHGTSAEILMQRADVAMYAAKRTGDVYAIYAPGQDQHSPRRLALIAELRQAIERDQLFLHYQPKIGFETGRIIGMEALVRWQHPEYGLVPPDQFIEPAEKTGLIKPLTRWVLKAVRRQCAAWHRAGIRIPVSANLSARNLQDPQLPDHVAELMNGNPVALDWLELEITESTVMTDPARAAEILKRLHGLGVRISIDDFGTGYSSLGYLKKLPVEAIKVDKSFVKDMIANESDAVIVKCAIAFGHSLGLKVIAEGVENRETWDRLAELDCDAAQGYYMCRPIPADELTRWLGESPWGLKGGPHGA